MNLLDVALSWAERGVPVFPLQAGSKVPCQGSHGVHDATTDPEAIKDLWCLTPDANVGLAVGAADPPLTVIDLDTKRGHDGPDEFFALQLEAGELTPTSFTVSTPSGGQHVYFRGKTRNRAAMVPGVDVRSDGGYVLAPGSRLDAREGQSAGVYAAAQDAPIEHLPKWLADRIGAPTERTRDEEAKVEWDTLSSFKKALTYLRQEVEKGRIAREGQGGNDFTFRTSAVLRDMGLSPHEIVDALDLSGWNDACEPPWHPDELQRIADNVHRYARRAAGEKALDTEALDEMARLAQRSGLDPSSRFKPISLDALESEEEPPMLISRTLPAQSTAMIYGQPGSYKTFAVLGMALSVATGTPWHGHDTTQGRVVYATSEGRLGLRRRLQAWRQHTDTPLADLRDTFYPIRDLPAFSDDTALRQFAEELHAIKPTLVILDTLAGCMAGLDENSTADATLFMSRLHQLQSLLECTVVLVHHSPKGKEDMRGSTVFPGAMDAMFLARKDGDQKCILKNTKMKDVDEWEIPMVLQTVKAGPSLVLQRPQRAEGAPAPQKDLDTLAAAHEATVAREATRKMSDRQERWGQAAIGVLEQKFERDPEATMTPYSLAKMVSETLGENHSPILEFLRDTAWRDVLRPYAEMKPMERPGQRRRAALFSKPVTPPPAATATGVIPRVPLREREGAVRSPPKTLE
ncbi:AAA family ATPase [uncultured Rhodospira sp.]|uniref:AAA family ATPase n=1 Tax=uncultured Rhodospira sp. TaxID=1936189 RepID=UPI00260B754D|nr:AAA family ATPase [uncultured Rhodospira sp.]